jgi:lipopolysaccharide export system protein LptA
MEKKLDYPFPERLKKGILTTACILGLIGLWPGTPAFSAEQTPGAEKKEKPITVVSDQLEADNVQQQVVFIGNVMAKQEDMTIYCDRLTVFYTEAEKKGAKKTDKKMEPRAESVKKITAQGNVKVTRGQDVAVGDTAIFLNQEQKIILSGNPKVWQGRNMIRGEEIVVLLKEKKSYVYSQGNKRVEATLFPEEKKD